MYVLGGVIQGVIEGVEGSGGGCGLGEVHVLRPDYFTLCSCLIFPTDKPAKASGKSVGEY